MTTGIAVQDQKWSTGGVRSGEAQALLPAGCNNCGACGRVAGLLAAMVTWSRGGLIAGRLSRLTTINPGRDTLALIDRWYQHVFEGKDDVRRRVEDSLASYLSLALS